jgi:hypothetical protein
VLSAIAPPTLAAMPAAATKPQNFEEKAVWLYLLWTYPLFFLGLHPILTSVLAWVLAGYVAVKAWMQTEQTPPEHRIRVPIGVWVWAVGMGILQIALIKGHMDFNYSLSDIVKGTFTSFIKGWAMFVLFPLIGSCLNIRSALLARGVCILSVQSAIVILYCTLSNLAKVPLPDYVPPLGSLGGVTRVFLSSTDTYLNETRLSLFAPWAPALGLLGIVFACVAYLEPNRLWRVLGMAGAVAMLWTSGSRTGQICLVAVPAFTFVLSRISRPVVQIIMGTGAFLAGVWGPYIYAYLRDVGRAMDQKRAASSAARRVIYNVSIRRWWEEAMVWGHGRLLMGPLITTYKPLGSHNTWAGLLFAYGIVGLVGFAIPLTWSAVEFFIKAQRSVVAQVAFAVLISLVIYMSSENIDFLVFLHWPGLIVMGMAHREKWQFWPAGAPSPVAVLEGEG